MSVTENMSDEEFERHALAVLQRELGLTVSLASFVCIDPGPATIPATGTAGCKASQFRKSWTKLRAATSRLHRPGPESQLERIRSSGAIRCSVAAAKRFSIAECWATAARFRTGITILYPSHF